MNKTKQLCYWLLGISFGFLALSYNAVGAYRLVTDSRISYPIDLRLRWIEQSLLYQGLNPQQYGHPDAGLPATHAFMKNVGGSYPPWSYATSILFVPPLNWDWTRYYFAALNILALFVIGFWAYREGVEHGKQIAMISVFSVGAIFAFAICLSYGQYAILIMAFLVMALLLSKKEYDGLAGLCIGVALVKPQLAALFLLSFLLQKKWRVVLAALVYVVVASCVTWLLIGCDPISMLRGMSREAELYYFLSHNPFLPSLVKSFSYKTAVIALASLGILLCSLLFLLTRKQSTQLVWFSICAVVTMFWTYRKHYDCVLLGFVIVNLLMTSIRTRSKLLFFAFLAFGCSLWIPVRDNQWNLPLIQYSHFLIWLSGLLLLVFTEKTPPALQISNKSDQWESANPIREAGSREGSREPERSISGLRSAEAYFSI